MMKRIVFPFLSAAMLLFSGCMDTGGNSQCFEYQPLIVGFSYEMFQPTIIFGKNQYIAPDLQDKFFSEIDEGDALIANFCIDYDQQPYAGYTTVYNLQYAKVETAWPQATTGGESNAGDFNYPIENVEILGINNYVLFLGLIHQAPTDQKFTYEMTYDRSYNSEDAAETPAVYIRAKNVNDSSSSKTDLYVFYSFNLSSFLWYHKGSDNKVVFRIFYKTGVDDEGNDEYKEYLLPNNEPIWVTVE